FVQIHARIPPAIDGNPHIAGLAINPHVTVDHVGAPEPMKIFSPITPPSGGGPLPKRITTSLPPPPLPVPSTPFAPLKPRGPRKFPTKAHLPFRFWNTSALRRLNHKSVSFPSLGRGSRSPTR